MDPSLNLDMDLSQVPAPDLTDPLFEPYWSNAADGKLVLPRCSGCGRVTWPPRAFCPRCRTAAFVWDEHAPRGTLFSWVTVGHPTAKGYSTTPYVVGIVALDDAPVRVMGTVVGAEPESLTIDMPLVARFARAGTDPEFTVIQWQPPAAGGRRSEQSAAKREG